MKKICLTIILTSICLSSVSAYNPENLIEFYRLFYKEELGIGFMKKQYQIKEPQLRRKILEYMKEQKLDLSDEEITEEWEDFVESQYGSENNLEKINEKTYQNLGQAKLKFEEDLDLAKYFALRVRPQIELDLNLRDKVLASVLSRKVNDIEFLEAKKQFLANSQVNTEEELLEEHQLTKEDLEYLIKSTYLLNKKSFSIYNLDLEKRIHNLKQNSDMSQREAKKLILKNYQNRIEYL